MPVCVDCGGYYDSIKEANEHVCNTLDRDPPKDSPMDRFLTEQATARFFEMSPRVMQVLNERR